MQQQIPLIEELKNKTVEELKSQLNELGVYFDSERKPKKAYIDMLVEYYSNNKLTSEEQPSSNTQITDQTLQKDFQIPIPIKKLKLRNKSQQPEIIKLHDNYSNSNDNLVQDAGKSTNYEESSIISESNLYSNLNNNIQFNSLNINNYNSNMNGIENNIKSEKVFLNQKRRPSESAQSNNHNLHNIINSSNYKQLSNTKNPSTSARQSNKNLASVNENVYKSEISKKYSAMKQENNVFKQPTPVVKYSNNKSFSTNNKQMTANSRVTDHRHVSSKSLKGYTNITNTVINDAFNNANIDFKDALSQSGVRPYRANSHISTSRISANIKAQKKFSHLLPQFTLAKENGDLDYPLIMRLIGGSLTTYALAYYFYKYKNESCFNLNNIITFSSNNSDVLLQGASVILFALLLTLIYVYYKQRAEYKEHCEALAKICYEDTITYFEEKEMENSQHHICEDSLIIQLSKTFNYSESKFIKDIYLPYLKNTLAADPRFVLKDLVEDGEIKAFYIYNGDAGFLNEENDNNNDLNLNY